jgi:hypothetical protein
VSRLENCPRSCQARCVSAVEHQRLLSNLRYQNYESHAYRCRSSATTVLSNLGDQNHESHPFHSRTSAIKTQSRLFASQFRFLEISEQANQNQITLYFTFLFSTIASSALLGTKPGYAQEEDDNVRPSWSPSSSLEPSVSLVPSGTSLPSVDPSLEPSTSLESDVQPSETPSKTPSVAPRHQPSGAPSQAPSV